MKIAILGAGFTGLELGRRLNELSEDFVIFEKESQIGGICRTNKTGEYHWDFAVHAMYSNCKKAMDYFLSLPLRYEYQNRNVKILHSGNNGRRYLLNYPFEMGVKDLPLRERLECIYGYITTRALAKNSYSNLEEWIDNCSGKGIAKHFMLPYNKKIWNCRLSEISSKIVSSKIDPPSAIDFILTLLGKDIVGRAYQAKFIYPTQGLQGLMDYTAKDIKNKIFLNTKIEKLLRRADKWIIVTDKGNKEEANIVISTIPLVELLKKIDIDGLEKEYSEFRWNDTIFIMIGLKGGCDFKLIGDCHWAFFKSDEIFYRVTLMHNFRPGFLPTLVAEVTQKGNIIYKTSEEVKGLVVKDLIRLGIVSSTDEIIQTDIKLLEYTYPIPTVGLEGVKERIRTILERHKLFLLGRNGNWDYINMDGVVMKVEEFVRGCFGFQ